VQDAAAADRLAATPIASKQLDFQAAQKTNRDRPEAEVLQLLWGATSDFPFLLVQGFGGQHSLNLKCHGEALNSVGEGFELPFPARRVALAAPAGLRAEGLIQFGSCRLQLGFQFCNFLSAFESS